MSSYVTWFPAHWPVAPIPRSTRMIGFLFATGIVRARAEAARALAVCAVCPVRAECLELSLRHWASVGQHGIWGGLVKAQCHLA